MRTITHEGSDGVMRRAGAGLCAAFVLLVVVLAGATSARAEFGIQPGTFTAKAVDPAGNNLTQAGAHPDLVSEFTLNPEVDAQGNTVPDQDLRGVRVDLPVGVVGDPNAVPQCSQDKFNQMGAAACPVESQVGVIDLNLLPFAGAAPIPQQLPVYNLVPPDGTTALLGFRLFRDNVTISARVRSDDDYGITATVNNVPGGVLLFGQKLTLWGVPADPSHNALRYLPGAYVPGRLSDDGSTMVPISVNTAPRAFFSNPTECGGVPVTKIAVRSWQNPDRWVTDEAAAPVVTGCEGLRFDPSFGAVPSTTLPDAPSGLAVHLGFAQPETPVGLASAQLKDARVTLPEGMTINPGSADGLSACGDGQLRLASAEPVSCPDSSRIGTVTAVSPALDATLQGGVYLRSQNSGDPASGEMFRIALVLEDAKRGISVRLPGQIKVDPNTGRIVTEFSNNPRLPVSDIDLRFKTGPRAPLATPASCGVKTVDAHFTSWAGQSADRQATFSIDCTAGLGGFSPGFVAGTTSAVGGAFSPFAVSITKPAGNSDLSGLSMSLPVGLLAKLKGNIGTQVGTVTTFAGPGVNPYALPGKVFLEGQYGDAPFSLRVVVPAVAGPFDLGTVEVRQKISIDPITAQVTVVSDPLPTIVKGVPVRLQRLEVNVDKPGFIVNPTSCAAKTVAGTLRSVAGQSVAITNRFQVGDCGQLALKPDLSLSLSGKGQNKDGGHPAVSATLTQPAGQANLKKVRVKLPLSLALDPDNSASDALCSFVEGSKPDPKCPASSVVGKATAVSPILNQPLTGPVYFVKNERKDPKSGRSIKTTPKLVIPLVGENGLKLTLTGTSDVVDDQLVTTFDTIPDAQVSSFKMDINGGKKGILVVSGDKVDICASTQIADQQIIGHNNKAATTGIAIQTPSCPLKILSKKVGKTSVAVKVGGLGAGKITISGRGIKKTSKTITKSTVATITARRTKGKPGKVTVSFDPAGPAKAHKTTK